MGEQKLELEPVETYEKMPTNIAFGFQTVSGVRKGGATLLVYLCMSVYLYACMVCTYARECLHLKYGMFVCTS